MITRNKYYQSRPLLIAITGLIASGKSLLANHLASRDFTVISADKVGHEILMDSQIIQKVKVAFGDSVIVNGTVNRNILRKIAFEDKHKLLLLNAITHLPILNRLQAMIDNASEEILFIEIPLLFDLGLEECFDSVIIVKTEQSKRLERLVNRRYLDYDEALRIISSQKEPTPSEDSRELINEEDERDFLKKAEELTEIIRSVQKRDIYRLV